MLIPDYTKPLPDLLLDVGRIIREPPLTNNQLEIFSSLAERFECTIDVTVKEILADLNINRQSYLVQF